MNKGDDNSKRIESTCLDMSLSVLHHFRAIREATGQFRLDPLLALKRGKRSSIREGKGRKQAEGNQIHRLWRNYADSEHVMEFAEGYKPCRLSSPTEARCNRREFADANGSTVCQPVGICRGGPLTSGREQSASSKLLAAKDRSTFGENDRQEWA